MTTAQPTIHRRGGCCCFAFCLLLSYGVAVLLLSYGTVLLDRIGTLSLSLSLCLCLTDAACTARRPSGDDVRSIIKNLDSLVDDEQKNYTTTDECTVGGAVVACFCRRVA